MKLREETSHKNPAIDDLREREKILLVEEEEETLWSTTGYPWSAIQPGYKFKQNQNSKFVCFEVDNYWWN